MVISTGLSVSIFNVLKYFFVIVFIETIARGALNNIHLFLRKFDLYKGKGTPLTKSRIDRYNLLQARGKRSLLRTILWTLLVTCFYAVEIAFEFSSDGVPQLRTRLERKQVYNASYSACEASKWLPTQVASHMASMAKSCVDLSENEYTLYRPIWIKTESQLSGPTPYCAKVSQNVLRRGERIYKDRRFTEGTPSWDAAANMVAALKVNASSINDGNDSSLAIMSVSTADIFLAAPLAREIRSENQNSTSTSTYRRALVVVHVLSKTSSLICGGLMHGTGGDKVSNIRMNGCFQNSTSERHYLQVQGTAPVYVDPDRMEIEEWTVDIAIYIGIAIRDFTKGVFNVDNDDGFLRLMTYTTMISAAEGKDSDSLNQYAAIHKHCDLLKVAVPGDDVQMRDVEYAQEEQKITVSLAEWGLTLVICWSFTLWLAARILSTIADRKGMPGDIDGELNISRRWAAHEDFKHDMSSSKQPQEPTRRRCFYWISCSHSKQSFLNVELNTEYDDIFVSRTAVQIERDISKPFKEA